MSGAESRAPAAGPWPRGPALLSGVALLLWLLPERGVVPQPRWLLLAASGLCWLAALGWRGLRLRGACGASRRAEGWQLAITAGGAAAFALYLVVRPETLAGLGVVEAPDQGALPSWVGVGQGLWLALLTCSVSGLVWVERARGGGPHEGGRLASAAAHGLALGLALVAAAGFNYAASVADEPVDLSLLRTSEPGEAVRAQVAALSQPVTAYLVFAQHADVLPDLRRYFGALAEAGPLRVKVVDHAMEPSLMRRHRVRDNGSVLLVRGEGDGQQAEVFRVGSDLASARSTLRTLDGHVVRALSALTRPPRQLHLTRGHGERDTERVEGQSRGQRLRDLRRLLERFNIRHKPLGLNEGLASGVPEQASAVAVLSPTRPFLPEEVQALVRYARAGGRLWLGLEPDVDPGLGPLLEALGVLPEAGVVTCEQNHLLRTRTPADREIVVSNRVERHAATAGLARSARRAGVVLLRAGAVRAVTPAPQGTRAKVLLRGMGDCFLDRDRDHQRDEGEPAGGLPLALAITVEPDREGGREGRAVVVGDGDVVTDQVLFKSEGNTLLALDLLGWLLEDEAVQGALTAEEDVPIEHRRDQDRSWFYATTYGVPVPIMLVGWWVQRRRARRAGARA